MLKDKMFIFGGDNYGPLASCEKFGEEWTTLATEMSESRDWVFAATIGCFAYIAGNKSSIVDCFDMETETIFPLGINHRSENTTMCTFEGSLYVF
jgi:hypothetical protein